MKQKIHVIISVAHSKRYPGASFQSFTENEESRIWSYKLKTYLSKYNISSYIIERETTPGNKTKGSLYKKVHFINSVKPIIAIEIHFNSSSNKDVNGCETLYYPYSERGKLLASIIHNNYKIFVRKDRGIKPGWFRQDTVKKIPLYFLKKTKCLAIIVEPEFITQKYAIINMRDQATQAIACGIKEFIQHHAKSTTS